MVEKIVKENIAIIVSIVIVAVLGIALVLYPYYHLNELEKYGDNSYTYLRISTTEGDMLYGYVKIGDLNKITHTYSEYEKVDEIAFYRDGKRNMIKADTIVGYKNYGDKPEDVTITEAYALFGY